MDIANMEIRIKVEELGHIQNYAQPTEIQAQELPFHFEV